MDDFLDFFQAISLEHSWPIYVLLYGSGLVITIIAIRKNKKKNAAQEQAKKNELDDLLN